MVKYETTTFMVMIFAASLALSGCVERMLTINSEPQGAVVVLNDEEIGVSPVTVSFNWYGDYSVRLSKDGYETLNTHRELKAPLHDYFPFDLFAQIYPARTVDSYEWIFELQKQQIPQREDLLKEAKKLKEQL